MGLALTDKNGAVVDAIKARINSSAAGLRILTPYHNTLNLPLSLAPAVAVLVSHGATGASGLGQEILTKKLAGSQETLIKTLLQQKKPSIKQG
jgi:hypothetical protein